MGSSSLKRTAKKKVEEHDEEAEDEEDNYSNAPRAPPTLKTHNNHFTQMSDVVFDNIWLYDLKSEHADQVRFLFVILNFNFLSLIICALDM